MGRRRLTAYRVGAAALLALGLSGQALMGGMVAHASTYSAAVLGDSPAAYYRLDEAYGPSAADSTGHGNLGQLSGGYRLGVPGALPSDPGDTALALDGHNGFLGLGDPADLQFSSGSVEIWLNTTSTAQAQAVVSKPGAFALLTLSGVLEIFDWGHGQLYSTGINVADGAWHHVVLSYASGVTGGTRVYVDGMATMAATTTVVSQAGSIGVGGLVDCPSSSALDCHIQLAPLSNPCGVARCGSLIDQIIAVVMGVLGTGENVVQGSPFAPFAGTVDELALYPYTLNGNRVGLHYQDSGRAQCATDAWATYGHDAARTSASGGCVYAGSGLSTSWRYVPAGNPKLVANAIAQSDGVFLSYLTHAEPYEGNTSLDRVTTSGGRAWAYVQGSDTDLGNWPSLAFGQVSLNEDALLWIDPNAGTKTLQDQYDFFGETTPDVNGLSYEVNTLHPDGPGLRLVARQSNGNVAWQVHATTWHCHGDSADATGSLAVDGGTVFQAATYEVLPSMTDFPYQTGLYALDAGNGQTRWYVSTTPGSRISAGHGLVYMVESGRLTARSQATGAQVWAQAPSNGTASGSASLGDQSPVIAGSTVVVGTSAGISAFDAATGTPLWTTVIGGGAATYKQTIQFQAPNCTPSGISYPAPLTPTTTIAYAGGSNSLVVTAGDGQVHVLNARNGFDSWQGVPSHVNTGLRNPIVVGGTVYVEDGTGYDGPGGLMALAQ